MEKKLMEKLMQKLVFILLASAITTCGLAQPALAIKQFSDEFMKLYKVDKKSENKSDFEKTVLEAKCWLCHQGKKKKHHNPYGTELAKLLDKKKDKKNPEKIVEALKKVAKLHTVAKDKKSPTYGELIKAGKLPGGSLKDAKKVVKEEDAAGKSVDTKTPEKKDASGKK